jgi:hypothetical protein
VTVVPPAGGVDPVNGAPDRVDHRTAGQRRRLTVKMIDQRSGH